MTQVSRRSSRAGVSSVSSDFALVSRIFRALELRFLKPLHRETRSLSSEPPRIIQDTNDFADSKDRLRLGDMLCCDSVSCCRAARMAALVLAISIIAFMIKEVSENFTVPSFTLAS